mmetsp:Transcript_11423/g.19938  ORF Transcript_11423/g.19938 Transcript_11423/m.19938 type:complete len:130 (-) Transcript_11423:511-900(-)
MMQKPGQEQDVEVTKEDQQRINNFNQLNQKYHELEDELKVAKDDLQKIEDASNELMLCSDDDPVKYMVGDSFVNLTAAGATELLEELKSKLEKGVEQIDENISEIKRHMQQMKISLYAKFGTSINLEEE